VAFALIVLGRNLRWPTAALATAGTPSPAASGGEPLLPKTGAFWLTVGSTALVAVHAIAACVWLFSQAPGATLPVEMNWSWLSVAGLELKLGTLLDAPAVMMLSLVGFISLLIQIYTHGYMKDDAGYAKFFSYLALFNFSMLGLVLSTNLIQTYMFWELVGLCSYLLIGFWFHKPAAGMASLKAFLVNRVGDFGFWVGLLLLLGFSFPWWQQYLQFHPEQALLSFQGFEMVSGFLAQNLDPWVLGGMVLLLFMGPMAKSAQFPLHTWLPDAMEGPTPISALIHAATMVAAGVYLLARLAPLLKVAPAWAPLLITIIGVITAVMGATMAWVQKDIKKALAYSTMSQLGFMVASVGMGAVSAALFHLFTHAFFKAMLFLGSGSVIHACEGEQNMEHMGGLWKKLPVTGMTYLIGTLAIAGIAFTSGFWSKDEILAAAYHHAPWVYGILLSVALLTSFYMVRTFCLTFMGSYRGQAHVHHEDPVMTTPLLLLAVPSVFIGFVFSGWFYGVPTFATLGMEAASHHAHTLLEALQQPVALQSMGVGLLGAGLAWVIYTKPVSLEKVLALPVIAQGRQLFVAKWGMDDIQDGIVQGGYGFLAATANWWDTYLVDGVVNGAACVARSVGQGVRCLQSGQLQAYLAFMVVLGAAVVLLCRLLGLLV
jgi:proton-translocating NADH-quinone oxidoreductase chain L